MEATVERLRRSKAEFEQREKTAGYAAGKQWAQDGADYEELTRLSNYEAGYVDDGGRAWEVLCAIAGGESEARADYDEFWERITGHGVEPSDLYAEGFVEGAVDVFGEVEDQL